MAKAIKAGARVPARKPEPPPRVLPEPEADDEEELQQPVHALPDEDPEQKIREIIHRLGGLDGASVTVNKVDTTGREQRCGVFSPMNFDEDEIRRSYGPGLYYLYFRVDGKLDNRVRLEFAQRLEEMRSDGQQRPLQGTLIPAADSQRDFMQQMMTQQRDFMNQIVSALTTRPAQDPMQFIEAASKLANMSRRDPTDSETILKWIDFGKNFNNNASEPGVMNVALEFAKAFGAAASAPAAPARIAAPGAQQTTNGAQQVILQQMIQQQLRQHLPMLISGAQSGSDASIYAQLILDQMPEMYLGPFTTFLGRPDWFDLLVQASQGTVVAHREWFHQLREHLLRATTQTEETTQPTT